jgi:murein DD-endopeptidase MepM/ murein hydrolase activator NlpD
LLSSRERPAAILRFAQHAVIVTAVLAIAVSSVGFEVDPGIGIVHAAQANQPSTRAPDSLLLTPAGDVTPVRGDRGATSVRDRLLSATPLPSPVPVNPAATPLAAPLQATAAGTAFQQNSAVLAFPVPGGSISQAFRVGHEGVDIAAAPGVPVIAAASGTVVSAGWRNNGGGLVVEIEHPGGLNTVYNHLGSIGVIAGQAVARGTVIGGMGCSGVCYGPHIQFDVRVAGRLVNPATLL